MPSSLLFATSSKGRVYTLSTSSGVWREFPYLGLEFKKISAVSNIMWAIGGDRQVYVHVHGLDVPIRVREETYENERWLPIEGFSKKLLPTDRPHYSTIDGTQERTIDKIRLPSMAWQWDGDWHLDLDWDGQRLAEDGWMYALDFPTTFAIKKSWNSYVRRRHWIRYRRYAALNSWCAVAPLHKDPTQEPFIDVAIGGTNIPNAPSGTLVVWAITAHGRAMFRTGVSRSSPEGLRWTVVSTPAGNELLQLSVGPTGLVWAVLFSGHALIRAGITRENLSGETWLDVKCPYGVDKIKDLKIVQVSVGTNSVWCITNDNSVWFRRGIKGELAGISEDAAIGNSWVEMIGNMSNISVAANDQVFAVGTADRAIYYRFGVHPLDLTGKKWRQIQLPMQISRTSSSLSIVSRKSSSSSTPCSKRQSFSNLYNKDKERAVVETCAPIENFMPLSTVNVRSSRGSSHSSNDGGSSGSGRGNGHFQHPYLTNIDLWKYSTDFPPSAGSLNSNERHKKRPATIKASPHASSAPLTEVNDDSTNKHFEMQLKNLRVWSPVHSGGSAVGTEAHPESDSTVFDADSSMNYGSDAFLGDDGDDHTGSQFWAECEMMWSCVAAGAVTVDSNNLPNWFNEQVSSDNRAIIKARWRQDLLEKLQERQLLLNSMPNISKYEKAVELSSWIKSAEIRYQHPSTGEYEDCLIELEWVTGGNTTSPPTKQNPQPISETDSGTFTVLHPDGVTTKIQFSLSAITCVQCCSEPSLPRLAIHATCLPSKCSPVRLQFSSDAEMEDWLSHLTSVCCQLNEVNGRPANTAIWTTTDLGDVFVYDPTNMKNQQWDNEEECYKQTMDVNTMETPYYNTLHNGMQQNAQLEITGCVYDDADQIRFDLQCHSKIKFGVKMEKCRVIAMHINPRFNEKTIVLNYMNDSEWQEEIRNGKMLLTPGASFNLKIKALDDHYSIFVNDTHLADYKHWIDPATVTCLYVSGRVKLFTITYRCPTMILNLEQMFWRQMGGHLKHVFSCSSGVVWGVTCDNTAWVYTGGWGGGFLKDLAGNIGKISTMLDTHTYYVYENQRWNPLSGFTAKTLPTDRHMWSDITGRQKRSKEQTKLLSSHYEWISDWLIDFNIPGGADKEGWQYAIDFPASYHGSKRLTDCVRRRRWLKKCRLMSCGPWQELSHSKILDVALQVLDIDSNTNHFSGNNTPDINTTAWAIASNGDVLYRHGVSTLNPKGDNWEHISSDQPLIGISISPNGQVWVVGRNGTIFYRYGITQQNVLGETWQPLEAPTGIHFRAVSVGEAGVWALDSTNRLAVRKEITQTFPEGSHWQLLPNVPSIPPHTETHVGFKSVSVGTEVWAIAMSGVICKRCGVSKENPAGAGWSMGIAGQWQHLSIGGFK